MMPEYIVVLTSNPQAFYDGAEYGQQFVTLDWAWAAEVAKKSIEDGYVVIIRGIDDA